MVTESGNKPPPAQVDYSKRRNAREREDLELDAAAQALLASIEEPARPKELAAAFPRIVNRMASLWRTPRQMNRYFEQLLTDIRTGRKGFSLGILTELTTLRDYYRTKVFPAPHDVWDSAEEAKGRDF
ncbi:MAG: hypothetical protein ACRET7_10105 [Burkholderiales bacterium]